MISKKLLSEVLNVRVHEIYMRSDEKVGIDYFTGDNNAVGFNTSMNIYELAHKCKEWAYSKGYEIKSFKRIGNFKTKGLYTCIVHDGVYRQWDAEEIVDKEPEAIFKACEWILNEV